MAWESGWDLYCCDPSSDTNLAVSNLIPRWLLLNKGVRLEDRIAPSLLTLHYPSHLRTFPNFISTQRPTQLLALSNTHTGIWDKPFQRIMVMSWDFHDCKWITQETSRCPWDLTPANTRFSDLQTFLTLRMEAWDTWKSDCHPGWPPLLSIFPSSRMLVKIMFCM